MAQRKIMGSLFRRDRIVEKSGSPLEASDMKNLGQDFDMPMEVILDGLPIALSLTGKGAVVKG